MPCSRTGIFAAGVIVLVAGVAMFAPIGGASDAPDRSVVRERADGICSRAASEASRLPRPQDRRESIALAAAMARLLRSTASELRSLGADDLAWAHQTWAAAIDDVRHELRSRTGSARAGATELVERADAAVAGGELSAHRCVQLAGAG